MNAATKAVQAAADSTAVKRIKRWGQSQREQFSTGEDQPLVGYAKMLGTYLGGAGAITLVGRVIEGRAPSRSGAYDLMLLSVATNQLSRMIAEDPNAASRLPESAHAQLARGLQPSTGESITHTMPTWQWVAGGFAAGLVFAPRQTRLVMATLSAIAASDFVRSAYAQLQRESAA